MRARVLAPECDEVGEEFILRDDGALADWGIRTVACCLMGGCWSSKLYFEYLNKINRAKRKGYCEKSRIFMR